MKKIATLILFTLLYSFTACSGDDDSGDNGDNTSIGPNEISFDISGAIEGTKTGFSYVVLVGDNMYMISSNDGTSLDDQTFSLTFYKNFADNSIDNPAPGTYPIGTVTDLIDQDGFWVVYTDLETDEEYGAQNVNGTMTITSNSNNQLKGTFEFTADGFDDENAIIEVTNGRFSAAID